MESKPSVQYLPGEEPEKIKYYLDQLFDDIRAEFPDGIVARDRWNHERWDTPAGKLSNYLGYKNGGDFLRAYGFKVVDTKPKKTVPDFDVDTELDQEPYLRKLRASTSKTGTKQHTSNHYKSVKSADVYRKKHSSFDWKKIIPVLAALLVCIGVFGVAVLKKNKSVSSDSAINLTESTGNIFQTINSGNSPEKIATKYFKAVKNGDLENGLACFTPTIQAEYSLVMKLIDSASSYFNIPVSNASSFIGTLTCLVNSNFYSDYEFKVADTNYQSDSDAIVTVDVYINGTKSESTKLLMKKIEGQWYIDEDFSAMTEESTFGTANNLTWEITKASPFSSGVAWVNYYISPKDLVSGVIDTSGNLIMTFDNVIHDSSQFDDFGYSYYYTDNGFKIIDNHGQITYTYNLTGTNSSVYVQDHGNGYFVIHEEISDFSSSANQIRVIDYNGNQLGNIVLNGQLMGNFSYFGEGIFSNELGIIINTKTGIAFDTDNGIACSNIIHPFSEDYAVVAYPKQVEKTIQTFDWVPAFTTTEEIYFFYCVPSDFFSDKETLLQYLETAYAEREPMGSRIKQWYSYSVGKELFTISDGYWSPNSIEEGQPIVFRSVDGTSSNIELKSLGDGIRIKSVGNFSNGYCPVFVRGNDDIIYLVLFDKTGSPVHDPIPAKISDYSKNGYTVFKRDNCYILSLPTGEQISIDCQDEEKLYGIDENYIYFNKRIYDIASKSFVFEKVIPTQSTVCIT